MKSCNLWLGAALDCWLIGAEASLVVPLRLARLARGGKHAGTEARLMVEEKLHAHGTLLGDLAGGRLGASSAEVISASAAHYLRLVRQNRRRLLGGMRN
jgi:hypothetical protein